MNNKIDFLKTLALLLIALCFIGLIIGMVYEHKSNEKEERVIFKQLYPKINIGELAVHRLTGDTLLVVESYTYILYARTKTYTLEKFKREELKRIK